MNCPRYDQLLDENKQSEYYQQVSKDYEVCIVSYSHMSTSI